MHLTDFSMAGQEDLVAKPKHVLFALFSKMAQNLQDSLKQIVKDEVDLT